MGKAMFCDTLKCWKQFCWDYIDTNLHSDTYWPHAVDAILWNNNTDNHCTVLNKATYYTRKSEMIINA